MYSWEQFLGQCFPFSSQLSSHKYWDIDPLRAQGLVTYCFHLGLGAALFILHTYTPLFRTNTIVFYLCHDVKRLGSSVFRYNKWENHQGWVGVWSPKQLREEESCEEPLLKMPASLCNTPCMPPPSQQNADYPVVSPPCKVSEWWTYSRLHLLLVMFIKPEITCKRKGC